MRVSKVALKRLVIDEIDQDVRRYKWRLSTMGYAIRGPNLSRSQPKAVRLHRLILERQLGRLLKEEEFVDHINGNKLDNRRSNLRLASKSQNAMNSRPRLGCSSRFTGVSWDSVRNAWLAYISVDGKRMQIIRCAQEVDAAWMRDQWAIALHGDFARLNFDYL